MKNDKLINISIADANLQYLATGGIKTGPRLSQLLDQEMDRFDKWMVGALQGGMSQFERAIVKTYLYHKIVGRIDDLEHNKTTTTP